MPNAAATRNNSKTRGSVEKTRLRLVGRYLSEIAVPTAQGVRFVRATSDGLTLGENVELGADFRCGTVVARPNGAAVIAGAIPGAGVAAVVREPRLGFRR